MVDGLAALRTFRGFRNLTPGMCLSYVWQAYKANGAQAEGTYGTALDGWHGSPGKHEGDRNPPAGYPVWFGARAGSSAGDVVISAGNGMVVCTDYPGWGTIGECTIEERQRQIGRPYLGWTETILGAEITVPSVKPPVTTKTIASSTVEMIIKAPNGTVVRLTQGFKKNFSSADEYNKWREQIQFIKDRNGTDLMVPPVLDEVVGVDWDTFNYACDYFGVTAK